eukprot:352427-Chlamydomonas_euryale.AAC.9
MPVVTLQLGQCGNQVRQLHVSPSTSGATPRHTADSCVIVRRGVPLHDGAAMCGGVRGRAA